MNLPCAECGERVDPTTLKKKTGTRSHKKVCTPCFKIWQSKDEAWKKHVKRENNQHLIKGTDIFGCLDALSLS